MTIIAHWVSTNQKRSLIKEVKQDKTRIIFESERSPLVN